MIYQPPPQCITAYIRYSVPPIDHGTSITEHRFIHSIVDGARIYVHIATVLQLARQRRLAPPPFLVSRSPARPCSGERRLVWRADANPRPLHDTVETRRFKRQDGGTGVHLSSSPLPLISSAPVSPPPTASVLAPLPPVDHLLFAPAQWAETRWGLHPGLLLERGVVRQHSCPPAQRLGGHSAISIWRSLPPRPTILPQRPEFLTGDENNRSWPGKS